MQSFHAHDKDEAAWAAWAAEGRGRKLHFDCSDHAISALNVSE